MLDWSEMVRLRLGALGLGAEREEEIRAELAEHLEDAYQEALRRGLSPEAAAACAYEQVPDWQCLARKIRRAGQEEDAMSHTAKTLWVPGMTALLGATLMLFLMSSLVPPTAWVGPKPHVLLLGLWLFSYLVFGALGAHRSRRAGGSITARLLSGTFPLALHLVIFIVPVVMAILFDVTNFPVFRFDVTNFPEHRDPTWLLGTAFTWLVIPGVALAIGTLPFLRDGAERASPASAQGIGC